MVPPQGWAPGYVRFLDGSIGDDGRVYIGEVYGDSAADDMQRIQIRETILSHLQKEEALFRRGIKCLSLFFIDQVAKYRDLSETAKQWATVRSSRRSTRPSSPTGWRPGRRMTSLDPSYAESTSRAIRRHAPVHSG